MLKDTFTFQGPLGEIECVVEPNRSENNAVLVIAHGFRGSRDSGGRAAGVAQQAAAHAAVVRYGYADNFASGGGAARRTGGGTPQTARL